MLSQKILSNRVGIIWETCPKQFFVNEGCQKLLMVMTLHIQFALVSQNVNDVMPRTRGSFEVLTLWKCLHTQTSIHYSISLTMINTCWFLGQLWFKITFCLVHVWRELFITTMSTVSIYSSIDIYNLKFKYVLVQNMCYITIKYKYK